MTNPSVLLEPAGRVERGELRALSIKQPYPHHIFYDGKDVENRDWPTKGRGWVIVHAGVSKTELDMDDPEEAAMPRGGVVGIMKITDCVQAMESRWFFGRYGFVIGGAMPLPLVPCKGALGFFRLDDATNASVAACLRALAAREG
jgi:hypothetical protein